MSRTAPAVKQADIARALRAAKQTDTKVVIEITSDGSIRLVPYEKSKTYDETITLRDPDYPRLIL